MEAGADAAVLETDEVELKYALLSHQKLPDLQAHGWLGAAQKYRLNAVYYDTPDLDLTRMGASLRRRSGGVDSGWHLKLKTKTEHARRELQMPIDGPRPPHPLRDMLPAGLRLKPLLPVARLVTVREEAPLIGGDGDVVARVAVDMVWATVPAGPHDDVHPTRTPDWGEVEVELEADDARVLHDLQATFLAAGVRAASYASKVSHALAMASIPEFAADSAGHLVLRYVQRQVGILQAEEEAARRGSKTSIEESKRAARRLRHLLLALPQLFEGGTASTLAADLDWYAKVLGAQARGGEGPDLFRLEAFYDGLAMFLLNPPLAPSAHGPWQRVVIPSLAAEARVREGATRAEVTAALDRAETEKADW